LDYTLPVVGTGGPDAGRTNAARDVGRLVVQKNIESIFKPLHEARYEDIASNGDYSVFVAWAADRRNHNKKMGVKGDNLNENGWAAFQSAYAGGGSKENDFSGVNRGQTFIRQTHVTVRGGTNVMNYKWNVGSNKKKFFIDNYEQQIPAYIKKAQKNVGRLKSGWYEAASALGRKPKAGSWIKDNISGFGYAVDESNNKSMPSVTIANRIHFLMGQGAGTTLWKSAFHHRNYAMREAISRRINKIGEGNPKRAEDLIAALELSAKEYSIE
jgi:hypothetical protein